MHNSTLAHVVRVVLTSPFLISLPRLMLSYSVAFLGLAGLVTLVLCGGARGRLRLKIYVLIPMYANSVNIPRTAKTTKPTTT